MPDSLKFKSRKDPLFLTIFFSVLLICGYTLYYTCTNNFPGDSLFPIILIVLVILLLLWVIFGTFYVLKEGELLYRCGPFRGSIKISAIKEITNGKTMWVGMRPATARNGVIIKYEKYNRIYISPERPNEFIAAIKKQNEEVVVL